MAKKPPASSAVRAAQSILRERIAPVEALGAAIAEWEARKRAVEDAAHQVETAAQRARAAQDEALAAGWTRAELRRAGLRVPTAPRTQGPRTSSSPSVVEHPSH